MNYYKEIKKKLVNNEIYNKVKDYSKNKSDLSTYYNVGKLLVEAQRGEERAKYGDCLIKEYSTRLTAELGKKYNYKTLLKFRKFYLFFQKFTTVSRQLTWSHYVELLKFDDINKINYYISITEQDNLSVRELRLKIRNEEYERLDENTKNKLMTKEENKIEDFIKNPIIIKNNYNYEIISEKVLKQLILEDITSFMKELGDGFCFIDSEYKIKIGDRYNYIDMLLYNINFNCYIVVELKVVELKAEHIGQIKKYMNYIDKNLKNFNQESTIGIIIVKKDNKFIMEYCSDERIFRTSYILN